MSAPTEERNFGNHFFTDISGKSRKRASLHSWIQDGWIRPVVNVWIKAERVTIIQNGLTVIRRFERQLTDNGYVLLKFFFMQIDRKEQEKRMGILLESKDTRWRVNEYDLWQNDHYKKCRKIFDQYMQDTNTSAAPWYIVDAG